MDIPTFYAVAHRGNAFGIKGPMYGPAGHRGYDFNRWAQGTPIPSYVGGQVVLVQRQTGLGWVVTVRDNVTGHYVGYCHLLQPSVVYGQWIGIGAIIGLLGNTGTLTTGPHTHTTRSVSGINPATAAVINPIAYIDQAIANASKPVPPVKKGDPEMTLYTCVREYTASGVKFPLGWGYIQVGNFPLRPLTNLEGSVYQQIGPIFVSIYGEDLALLSAIVGITECAVLPSPAPIISGNGKMLEGPGALTGRVAFLGSTRPVFPGSKEILGQWHYPAFDSSNLIAGAAATITPADISAIAAASAAAVKPQTDAISAEVQGLPTTFTIPAVTLVPQA